jgi:cytochrome c peroxidase
MAVRSSVLRSVFVLVLLLSTSVALTAEPITAEPTTAQPWVWALPPGFPRPVVPADNPLSRAKVELGARLFAEKRLSVTGQYSCASCHLPQRDYTDGRSLAMGATGEPLSRNALSLYNVAWNSSLGWSPDGAADLETQMLTPLLAQHPVELGLPGIEPQLLQHLANEESYRNAFAAAYPQERSPINRRNLVRAIASFERSLIAADSDFDRYLFGDQRNALNAAARRGMDLFLGRRTGCTNCHSGILFSGPVRTTDEPNAVAPFANNGIGDTASLFRVPTLRNVARTGPYMHDGSMTTLAEVLEHYSRRGPGAEAAMTPIRLSTREKTDLLAFLQSLTGRPAAIRP